MSRLAKQLHSDDTGKLALNQVIPSLSVRKEFSDKPLPSFMREFRMIARFSATYLIDTNAYFLMNNPDWANIERETRRGIVEEVFGEFRPLINQAISAINRHDWRDASENLRKLYSQMFEEGI